MQELAVACAIRGGEARLGGLKVNLIFNPLAKLHAVDILGNGILRGVRTQLPHHGLRIYYVALLCTCVMLYKNGCKYKGDVAQAH